MPDKQRCSMSMGKWLMPHGTAFSQTDSRLQDQGVMAMVRHYIGNEEETGRQWTSSNIDDR